MIRQAISCDVCGAEKKQTNHWFVAWEQGSELRLSGWNSRNRMRAGAKHLCGQVCLHKLADDFMVRVIAQKSGGKVAGEVAVSSARQEMHLHVTARPTLGSDGDPVESDLGFESSARLLPEKPVVEREPLRFAARNRHAEAWARERERNERSAERSSEAVARKRRG